MKARTWPHPLVTAGTTAGAAIALAPGSLPREALIQGVLLAAFAGIGALIGMLASRFVPWPAARARKVTAAAGGLVIVAMFVQMIWWQLELRWALGTETLDLGWVAVAAAPSGFVAVGVALPSRIRMIGAVLAAAIALSVAPSPAGAAGSGESVAHKFTAVGAQSTSLRVYGELDTRDVTDRAQNLVKRWQAAGGMHRSAVVVAVPTGSGWVDPDALVGIESRMAGDVGVVALQYSDIPSWQAFLSSSAPARDSAIAVTAALIDAVNRSASPSRPHIYLYGQSLGAVGADAARQWAQDNRSGALCHTVLAGAPAGTASLSAASTTVLANGSDPVVRWSPRLIWQPPALASGITHDLPTPPWLPVAGFVQASADLIGALSFPAGHGHQYGTEQGHVIPFCPR
ncbi:alpha/beta-hydrolase family protein [Williamsia muralis]|uniref:Alpha/beta-hydrolase family protein n=1 Tax=Williamsia marianensis TaxID=85044 RepID=A0ABU4EXV9_WILMA|nr:alpha/beta-hydrolase family protein [Williamsia muralis]MDV7136063.1 alpha/beta-hydrolase family protein [Williamsia muralis]